MNDVLAASNASDTPKADTSKSTDNTENPTAAVKGADANDTNETEAFKKPSGNLTAVISENKSFKNPLQHGNLNDKD